MIKLDETRIYGLNDKWDNGTFDALGLMLKIYHEILNTDQYVDSMWHFFWEGSYTVIRHYPGKHQAIADLVRSIDKDLTVVSKQGGYQENIPVSLKYLRAFLSIFHGYSILAMEMEDKDFLQILERNNHCFMSMVTRKSITEQYKIPGDVYGTDEFMGWEAIALHSVAHQRAWTSGFFNAGSLESKTSKDKKAPSRQSAGA